MAWLLREEKAPTGLSFELYELDKLYELYKLDELRDPIPAFPKGKEKTAHGTE